MSHFYDRMSLENLLLMRDDKQREIDKCKDYFFMFGMTRDLADVKTSIAKKSNDKNYTR